MSLSSFINVQFNLKFTKFSIFSVFQTTLDIFLINILLYVKLSFVAIHFYTSLNLLIYWPFLFHQFHIFCRLFFFFSILQFFLIKKNKYWALLLCQINISFPPTVRFLFSLLQSFLSIFSLRTGFPGNFYSNQRSLREPSLFSSKLFKLYFSLHNCLYSMKL